MTERMYGELADWWTLLSPVEEYVEEAGVFAAALLEYAPQRPRTMLELGAGGGHNAFHLKAHFEMTLVDRSEDMLRQSRKLNPELTHHLGDMRTVRLGRSFDAVFVHDAVTHILTRADLRRVMETAFVHCREKGLVLFVPDETKERFVPRTSCGGSDDGRRGFRYLEWCWDPDPDDDTMVTDYAYLIREEAGEVRVEHDRHLHGLFPRQVWLDTLAEVGFEPHCRLYDHSDLAEGYELFIGVKR